MQKRFKYHEDIRFVFERIGYSSKMNEMEAAIGIGNLEIYNEILEKRRKNLYLMMKKFKKFDKYFITFKENSGEKIGPHAFPITLRENIGFNRNQLVDFLGKNKIDTRNLFSSMPTQCRVLLFLDINLDLFQMQNILEIMVCI